MNFFKLCSEIMKNFQIQAIYIEEGFKISAFSICNYMHFQFVFNFNYKDVVSAPAWDGTGCEFDSWQCQIYIPCSLSLRLLGSLRSSLGTYCLTQKLCYKKQNKKNKFYLENSLFSMYLPSNNIKMDIICQQNHIG